MPNKKIILPLNQWVKILDEGEWGIIHVKGSSMPFYSQSVNEPTSEGLQFNFPKVIGDTFYITELMASSLPTWIKVERGATALVRVLGD